jgi:hypothetical protein
VQGNPATGSRPTASPAPLSDFTAPRGGTFADRQTITHHSESIRETDYLLSGQAGSDRNSDHDRHEQKQQPADYEEILG